MRLLLRGLFPSLRPRRRFGILRQRSGLTLVEVMISTMILAMVTLGILSTLLSTRQMTDFTRKQLLVDTAVQGILEQLKNRTAIELLPGTSQGTVLLPSPTPPWFKTMTNLKTYISNGGSQHAVKIELDSNQDIPLTRLIISPYDPITFDPATKIRAGSIPADTDGDGYGDLDGDHNDDVGVNLLKLDVRGTTGVNGSTRNTSDDLNIYLMVYITDATQTAAPLMIGSRQIIIYYTWIYREGSITRPIVDNVRAIFTPL